jgi:hypothetical protein
MSLRSIPPLIFPKRKSWWPFERCLSFLCGSGGAHQSPSPPLSRGWQVMCDKIKMYHILIEAMYGLSQAMQEEALSDAVLVSKLQQLLVTPSL